MEKIDDETGIYRLDDGRLRIRVTAKVGGKIRESQRTLKEGVTLEEARKRRIQLREKLRQEGRRPGPRIDTLDDYCEWWIERKAKRVKKSTAEKYARVLGQFVLPELGHIRMSRLTRRDIAGWIAWAERQRKGNGEIYATATVQSWWRAFRTVLRDAYAQGYLDADLAERQTPPDTGVRDRQEKRTLSADQLGDVVEATAQFYPGRYAEVVTLAYTGMRVGELYGIEWRDIELSEGVIKVRRSVYNGEVTSTKTDAARTVPIPRIVVEALEEHREDQMRDQAPGWEDGIVFPSDVGTRRYPSSLRNVLTPVAEHLDSVDQKVTPQVLRRTYNTLMVEAKVDRIVLRSMIGHSSEEMTERYAGVGLETKKRAIEAVFDA